MRSFFVFGTLVVIAVSRVVDEVPADLVALKLEVGPKAKRLIFHVNSSVTDLERLADSFCAHETKCSEIVQLMARRAIETKRFEAAAAGSVFSELPEHAVTRLDLGGNATVVTVATSPDGGLRALIGSLLARAPATLYILGLGLPFVGTVQKLSWTRSFLRRRHDIDALVFVDAYDTVFQHAVTIPRRVILFGADRVCNPEVCAGPLAIRRFLNSGSYAGRAVAILSLLDLALANNAGGHRASDQFLLSNTCLSRATTAVGLDMEGRHFAPLDGIQDFNAEFSLDAPAIVRRDTGHAPAVIHGNGRRGKELLASRVYPHLFSCEMRSGERRDILPCFGDLADGVLDAILARLRVFATLTFLEI